MSSSKLLTRLQFVRAEPTARRESIEDFRKKFADAVDMQIKAAEAHAKGEKHTYEGVRYVGKGEDRVKQVVQKEVRPWFHEREDGQWVIAIRYGNRPLRITDDGRHAVLVKNFKDVVPTFRVLADAALKGELDEAITEARKSSKNASAAKNEGGDEE